MAGAILSQCSAESIAMLKAEGQDFGNKFGNPVYLNLSLDSIIPICVLKACLIFLMHFGTNVSTFSILQAALQLACMNLLRQLLLMWYCGLPFFVIRSSQLLMIYSGQFWSTYMLEVFVQTCSSRTAKSGSHMTYMTKILHTCGLPGIYIIIYI